MTNAVSLAQTTSIPESGDGALFIWALAAVVLVILYVVVSRTRKRSYQYYMSRAEREAELKAQDPDMKSDD